MGRSFKLAIVALAACVALSGCSILGKPGGPGGSLDGGQQKVIAAAAIVAEGVCGDLRSELKPEELAEARSALVLLGGVLGNVVTIDQAQGELRTLMGSNARMTRTLASVVFAVGAFTPVEYKQSVGLGAVQLAVTICTAAFSS